MVKKICSLFLLFIACMVSREASAQLCTGSLGDAIINTDFGAGSNPGPALGAATTNYQYSAGDCPNDGFYTLRSNSNSCFGNTWHSLATDHTGNTGGYFMLVNASVQPSAFYLDTVRGLCANSTYEFAAWILNMIVPSACNGNSIRPDITFRIERPDGTVLQTYNTGSISSTATPSWKQYGFFFTTPAGIPDVVLRMINNSQGGCGNDLALDDISFRPCGPKLTPSITGTNSTTAQLCAGTPGSVVFNCTVSAGFNNPSFQWQSLNNNSWTDIPGETTTTLTRNFPATTAPGNFVYRLTVAEAGNMGSAQCRIASTPVTVQVNPLPATTALNDGAVCSGRPLQLTATGGATYQWTGPLGFSSNSAAPVIANTTTGNSGKYYVLVTDANGCSKKDSTVAVVNPAPTATATPATAIICQGDTLQLSAAGGQNYAWQPATMLSSSSIANPKAFPLDTTTYRVTVSNSFGCSSTATVQINVLKKPTANAGPDRYIIAGQPIQIMAAATGSNLSYNWINALFINDPTLLQPTVNPPADQRYILEVSTSSGCGLARDTMMVKVYNGLHIPSAFTPNGDNINDNWNIPALGAYPKHEISVFNRFGEMVFHNAGALKAWNGKYKGDPLPTGAYVYLLVTEPGAVPIRGSVLLLR